MSFQHHPLADLPLGEKFPSGSIFIIMELVEEEGIKTVIHLFLFYITGQYRTLFSIGTNKKLHMKEYITTYSQCCNVKYSE